MIASTASTSDDSIPANDTRLVELLADREQMDPRWRPWFVSRCRVFLREQRLKRIEPYLIVGGAMLLNGPLAVAICLLAEHQTPGELAWRKLAAYAGACLVSVTAAAIVGREAWLMDRRVSGRRLGEAWDHYRRRVRGSLIEEGPGRLNPHLPAAEHDPWSGDRAA